MAISNLSLIQTIGITIVFAGLLVSHCFAEIHCKTFELKGSEAKRLTVNGELSGPTVKARKGDTVVVKVQNQGDYNITIYWHDGLSSRYITKGRIQSGDHFSFVIELKKEEVSLWWHAISDDLDGASVHGAVVVPSKANAGTDFISTKPHKEIRAMLEEWQKDGIRQKTEDFDNGDLNTFNEFTISGQPNDLNLCSTSAAATKKNVGFYELKKGSFSVKVTNWGATIVSVVLPDSKGKLDDVILGFDTIDSYVSNPPYFGALIGRVANRIAGAQFTLNGTVYKLPANNGNNTLHGGHRGFSHVIWTVKEQVGGEFPYITLYYRSFDGEQGFPGALDVYATYKISGPYELSITMHAKSLNKATPVNLANHGYWNLGGQNSGTILSETVQIFASKITPVNDELIPTGKFSSVKGTPYDFLTPKTVGSQIGKLKGGYDINYVLDNPSGVLKKVAVVKDGRSGRGLEVWANQPGVQFYTANTLEAKGKGGFVYGPHAALCLETQGFPDAVNHPNFPSQIVNPGQEYKHDMLLKFSF